MAYTTIDKPSDYFETKLWSGNATDDRAISGLDFAPNWVWIKNRTDTNSHAIFDTVRGATKYIESDTTDAEATGATFLKSFTSDGFTLGTAGRVNANSQNYVSWNWKAGTSFTNDASSTGIGTIDSTGSVNQTAGFSIVSYTGNATDNASVKHGLNTAPKMVIIKDLSDTSTWGVWHQTLTNGGYKLTLNTNSAQVDDSGFIGGSNRAIPTSSVFFLGSGGGGNGTNANIAYCFSEVKGYSKFGSYTGNGNADGTFVYTGFKPSFVIIKNSSNAHNWTMIDNKRLGYNDKNYILFPDLNNVEPTTSETDILSNGFKIRASANGVNQSGNTMIYMAFAENPFVTSTGIPTTAR